MSVSDLSVSVRSNSPSMEDSEDRRASRIIRENQQVADVMRAHQKLASMKAFRVNNEKHYRDKELQDIRKREIQKPLDEALTTIDILSEKLIRRDMMIQKLRKYITVDLLKSQQSNDDMRSKVIEINQTEEQNQVLLMDTIAELQKVIEEQSFRISHCKEIINVQKEHNKQISRELEMQEINYKELIRSVESEKEAHVRLAEAKENKIHDLQNAKQNLEGTIERLKEEINETLIKYRESQSTVCTLEEEARRAQIEFNGLQARYSSTELALFECKDHVIELKERYSDLRTRYETLVTELDEMVEAGCYIPSAEELAAYNSRSTKKETRKTSSTKSKGSKGSSKTGGRGLASSSLNAGSSSVDGEGSFDCPSIDELGDQSSKFSNINGDKFRIRKGLEDSACDLKIAESKDARLGNVLGKEIAQLRHTIAQMKSEHLEAIKRAGSGKSELEATHAALKNDFNKLTIKNQELSAKNFKMSNNLQEKNQQIIELERETTTLQLQVEQLSIAQEQRCMALEELQVRYANLELQRVSAPPIIYDDELSTAENNENDEDGDVDFGAPPEYDPAFDINDFISAPPVDVSTQIGASEFFDMATQFPYLYDPDWQPNHVGTQTDVSDFMYPTEHYLEALFRDFVEESKNHIPEQNLKLLRSSRPINSVKEPKSRLGHASQGQIDQAPLIEEAATFRVKRGLIYLGALNDQRNKHIQFINQTGTWNTINTRMVVRCLDLILQTVHNVLCPSEMLEDSDYDELRKATDDGDENYYSDDAEDSQVYGELQEIANKWKSSAKAIMKRDSTFKLTETELAAEHSYGAPKGLLNSEPGQTLTKAVVKYMNRAVRRRQTTQNVDLLLEQAEGRAPPTPQGGSPTNHRISAPPSRSGIHSRNSNGNRSRSNSESPERTTPGSGVSPLVSAFAAKALAAARIALSADSASPDASPTSAYRKRLSASFDEPIPEAIGVDHGDDDDRFEGNENQIHRKKSTDSVDLHIMKAVQGYYNFGYDNYVSDNKLDHSGITMMEVPASLVGVLDHGNVYVKMNQDRSVGAAFDIRDEIDSEGKQRSNRKKSRSRSPKRNSLGYCPDTLQRSIAEEYVDFTRIPFDAASAENSFLASTAAAMKSKKMSISGVSTGVRKSSHVNPVAVSHEHVIPTDAQAQTAEESNSAFHAPSSAGPMDLTSSAPRPPDLVSDDVDMFTLQGYMDNMNRDKTNEPSKFSPLTTLPDEPIPASLSADGLSLERVMSRPTSNSNISRVPFPIIPSASAIGTEDINRPDSSMEGNRTDLKTPTLADRAMRIQLKTPLPQPQPTMYTSDPSDWRRKSSASSAPYSQTTGNDQLKITLQKSIEASARAVYQLQVQQQRSNSTELGLKGSTALPASSACPPSKVRPSSTRRMRPSARNTSQPNKPQEIDWSNPTYVPTIISGTNMDAGWSTCNRDISNISSIEATQVSVAPVLTSTDTSYKIIQQQQSVERGMLSQDGNVDLDKLLLFQRSARSSTEDSAVEIRSSSSSPHKASQVQQVAEGMVVAGRKRSIEAGREKVTNALLYM